MRRTSHLLILIHALVLDAKSHRANILNVSREPPSPISFWPISNNLHDTTTKSNRRYAVLNGPSIRVPGVYSSPDFGYVEVNSGNSITIQNIDGNMDGDDAMTWVFYVRMTSPQTATLLQYTGSAALPGFTFGINGNELFVSFLDTNNAPHSFTSELSIPVDGSWVFIGFTFNKLWTNDDHIDLIYFHNGKPKTSTFGLGTNSVSVDAHGDIIIGKALDNKQPFTGDITCIQFYDTSLMGGTLEDSIELCDPTLNTLQGDYTLTGQSGGGGGNGGGGQTTIQGVMLTKDSSLSNGGSTCDSICEIFNWNPWSDCTASCAGGTRTRHRTFCCPTGTDGPTCLGVNCKGVITISQIYEQETCNEFCYNDGSYSNTCQCTAGWTGQCCDTLVVCGNPDKPNNSRLVVQDYYYSNLSAVVCDVGYAVSSGDAIRLCNSSGLWNGTKAVCSLADWKYDPNGGHGNFSYLLVDKSTLSKQRRMLFSVYERHTSKMALGATGITIMSILCFYLICMDCLSLLRVYNRGVHSGINKNILQPNKDYDGLSKNLIQATTQEKLFHNRLKFKPNLRFKKKF
ncbi:uncharacterized protein LOC143070547 [Mytilus galloprovincialis]|uniref:uncharacterized protein LOC143070547 n=1 Tax=Mytilus galloprovincialis TaxID=29158 RepID=UPI003F7BA40C